MHFINDELNTLIDKYWFPSQARIFFVLGYPLSDIGKGHVVAHLGSVLPRSGIVKFDGHLRRSSPGVLADDFQTYKRYNPQRTFGAQNQLRGGDILYDFLSQYGHRHSIAFSPDVVKYFVYRLCVSYRRLRNPDHFIVEIGGTVHAAENRAYVLKAIEYIHARLGKRCKVLLLTTLEHRTFPTEQVKTHVVQDACQLLKQEGLQPDVLFVREPVNMPPLTPKSRSHIEAYISNQLSDYRMIYPTFEAWRVIALPHYSQETIDDMGRLIGVRMRKLRSKLGLNI